MRNLHCAVSPADWATLEKVSAAGGRSIEELAEDAISGYAAAMRSLEPDFHSADASGKLCA